ncbi:phytanoyl-CoA dioxygenase family protein [Actinomycetospora endophytica]|uniref:Phytanoyl-CoA dioxygenase family protein n=1 Tax=Actinomycetospora endophytica TaxID=2291215 RepID=A0ABS8P0R4_9PSEU|nr:phytanoyl-CoA dioxygenase family protein [Actinomycetospora endophytica]MCD2191836.1 phytanoyl-CoA dioxygenase family protein [Actinomycetospora endophytica]
MSPNPYLSAATEAGEADDVGPAWDGDNDQWWDWYMSLADDGGPAGDLVALAALDLGYLPDDDTIVAELAEPYDLPPRAVETFAEDGFIVLPDVVSPGAAEVLRRRLGGLLADAKGSALRAREMIWREDPLVRAAVLSPRIARICAALLEVEALRLYHDSALCKEPGAGRTPWHHDAHHFPLDSHDVISTWMPLQPVPAAMGPLSFARGMDTWRLLADLAFDKVGTSYDRRVAQTLREAGAVIHDQPFALGDVSFHSTLCFHTAGANRTTQPRMVLGATYFADGARVVEHPTMVSGDWQVFIPRTAPGEPAASPNNPLVTGLAAPWQTE